MKKTESSQLIVSRQYGGTTILLQEIKEKIEKKYDRPVDP
jgi:hypothetical protein